MNKKCVVLLSGGMDSTTILYNVYNSDLYSEIYCLGFDYNQRHNIEINYAQWHIRNLNDRNKHKVFWKLIPIHFLKEIAPVSCLTNTNINVPDGSNSSSDKLPTSYVPNRNMILLSIAASYAESIGAEKIYHGAVAADLDGGYWDCRPEFFEYLNKTLNVNFEHKISIETPLINMSKKDIILLGVKNKVPYEYTWTDYSGGKDDGYFDDTKSGDFSGWVSHWKADATSASSKCRLQGFAEAGYIDPLSYQQDLTEFWKKHNCIAI